MASIRSIEYLAAAPGLLALLSAVGYELWNWQGWISWGLCAVYAVAQGYLLHQLVRPTRG